MSRVIISNITLNEFNWLSSLKLNHWFSHYRRKMNNDDPTKLARIVLTSNVCPTLVAISEILSALCLWKSIEWKSIQWRKPTGPSFAIYFQLHRCPLRYIFSYTEENERARPLWYIFSYTVVIDKKQHQNGKQVAIKEQTYTLSRK